MTAEVPDRPRRARLTHEPALDGIRGAAVLGVLVFHGEHLAGGYLGVDAFFVLSGFLITSLLLAEHRDFDTVSLRAFWARRARRLLPALAVVLAAVAAYAAWVAEPSELSEIRGDALATIGYIANWREIASGFDYFGLFRRPSPLQHTWSLAIEEQFYVLWPLAFVLLTRRRSAPDSARRVLRASLIGAVVSVVLAQLLYSETTPTEPKGGYLAHAWHTVIDRSTNRAYYGTDTRIAAILFGAALAAWLAVRGHAQGPKARRRLEIAAIIAVVGLGVAWARLPGDSIVLYRGGLIACGLAVTLIIAAGVHPERGLVAKFLSIAPLRALGLISYGAYLWHWPIYVYLDSDRVGVDGWGLLGVRLAVTLGVSAVSYWLVERPIRRGAGSKRTLRLGVPAVAVVVVVAIIGGTAGAPADAPKVNANGRGGVLVVGDSVAHSLFGGFVSEGFRVREAWAPGCRLLHGELPFENQYTNDCPWTSAFASAVERARPDVVVLITGTWELFDIRPPGATDFISPGSKEWNDYYATNLNQAIDILGARGATVIVPSLPCLQAPKRTPGFGDHPSAADVERVRVANGVLEEVIAARSPRAATEDLFGYLCPDGEFDNSTDGVDPVREDGVHYTEAGAALIARKLAPLIDDVARPRARLRISDFDDAPLAVLYGDTLMQESASIVDAELSGGAGWVVVNSAAPAISVCDMVAKLRADLIDYHPDVVLIETHGGSLTPCMRSEGHQIARDDPEFLRRHGDALDDFFRLATDADAIVVFVDTPADGTVEAERGQRELAALAREVGAAYPGVRFADGPRLALGGDTWVATMPCLEAERALDDCVDGQIRVRGPDRVSLCPSGYDTIQDALIGCRRYSSGALRYGRAIAQVLRDLRSELEPGS
jgi:peptidoglycan/LPS O-acetylase OafA/YrhL/lysophospholipase L1-like esterase